MKPPTPRRVRAVIDAAGAGDRLALASLIDMVEGAEPGWEDAAVALLGPGSPPGAWGARLHYNTVEPYGECRGHVTWQPAGYLAVYLPAGAVPGLAPDEHQWSRPYPGGRWLTYGGGRQVWEVCLPAAAVAAVLDACRHELARRGQEGVAYT